MSFQSFIQYKKLRMSYICFIGLKIKKSNDMSLLCIGIYLNMNKCLPRSRLPSKYKHTVECMEVVVVLVDINKFYVLPNIQFVIEKNLLVYGFVVLPYFLFLKNIYIRIIVITVLTQNR